MALTDNIQVVLPPPSEEFSKFKPFPPSFDAIVDEILSEEASFDVLGDEDWPVNSACPSEKSAKSFPERVTTPASETQKPTKKRALKSPYFPTSPISINEEKAETTRPQKRATARRSITIVDMASEGEEEIVPAMDNHPNGNSDVDSVVDENSTDIKAVEFQNDARKRDNEVVETVNEVYLQPPNSANYGDLEPGDPEDEAEEDVIFASVGPSKGEEIIQYVVTHEFFEIPVQPVSRSARLKFTFDLRGMAVSAGMPDAAVDSLLRYVRRIYLDTLGAPAELSDNLHEITFGEEFDDTPKKTHLLNRARKRSLDQTDESSSKKRKTGKRRSSEDSNASVTAVIQVEDSQGVTGADSRIHTYSEELRQERIGFTDAMDGPNEIPESPILAVQPLIRAQEEPRAGQEIIDLTYESDHEQTKSNRSKSQDNEPLRKLNVALEESLVMGPPVIADKSNAPDESSLELIDSNPFDQMEIEPEAESAQGDKTERVRHGSKKNNKKNKRLSVLNPQPNQGSIPLSELQSANVPSETFKQNKRKTMKNKRKRENKRNNKKDKASNLSINPDEQEMTPPQEVHPAQAPAPSTPASQPAVTTSQEVDSIRIPLPSTPASATSSSKPASYYGQLSPNPNQWEMDF